MCGWSSRVCWGHRYWRLLLGLLGMASRHRQARRHRSRGWGRQSRTNSVTRKVSWTVLTWCSSTHRVLRYCVAGVKRLLPRPRGHAPELRIDGDLSCASLSSTGRSTELLSSGSSRRRECTWESVGLYSASIKVSRGREREVGSSRHLSEDWL